MNNINNRIIHILKDKINKINKLIKYHKDIINKKNKLSIK